MRKNSAAWKRASQVVQGVEVLAITTNLNPKKPNNWYWLPRSSLVVFVVELLLLLLLFFFFFGAI
jgi:hypothetical protein